MGDETAAGLDGQRLISYCAPRQRQRRGGPPPGLTRERTQRSDSLGSHLTCVSEPSDDESRCWC
jgi:hypothetical protein